MKSTEGNDHPMMSKGKDTLDISESLKTRENNFDLLAEKWKSGNGFTFLGKKQISSLSRSMSRKFASKKKSSREINGSHPDCTSLASVKGRSFQGNLDQRLRDTGRRVIDRRKVSYEEKRISDMRKRSLNSLAELKAWASKSINRRNISHDPPNHGPRDFLCAVSKRVSNLYVRRTSREDVNEIDIHGPNDFHLFTSFKQSILKVKKEPRKKSETEILLKCVLSSPISSGYFMAFCEAEYNSEYLEFYLAVEDLKKISLGVGTLASSKNRMFTLSSKYHVCGSGSGDGENWRITDDLMFDNKSKRLQKKVQNGHDGINFDSDDDQSEADILDIKETANINFDITRAPNNSPSKNVPWHKEHWTKDDSSRLTTKSFSNLSILGISKKINNDNKNKNNKYSSKENSMRNDRKENSEIKKIFCRFILDTDMQQNASMINNSFSSLPLLHSLSILRNHKIILPEYIVHNTSLRIEFEGQYKSDVFAEAVAEVFVILKRDIFLRFIKSNLYEKLVLRGKLVYDFDEKYSNLLPKGNRLQMKIPESKILNDVYNGQIMNQKDENKLYDLKEILTDGLLFNEFLSRLKSLMCSESILCVRMITVFKEFVSRCLSQSLLKSYQLPHGMKKFNSVRSAGQSSHNSSASNWNTNINTNTNININTNTNINMNTNVQQQTLNQLDMNIHAQQLLQQSSPNFHTNLTIITDTISNSNSNSNLLTLNSLNLFPVGGGIGTNGIATNNSTNNSTNTGPFSTPNENIPQSIPRSNSHFNLQLMTQMVTNISNISISNGNSNLNSNTNSNINSTKINRNFSDKNINVKSKKGKISTEDMNIILDKAWEIYLFFLAKGSAYEISIPNNQRIEIMRMLGNPNLTMFDQLESIAMRELVHCFKNYKESKYYPFLNKSVLRTASKIKNIELGSDSFFTRKFKKAFRSNLCKVYAI